MPSLNRLLASVGRKVSLPAVLIAPFVVQIVGVVSLTGYLSVKNGRQAVNDLATQLQSEISSRLQQELSNYLEVPYTINQLNANAIKLGQLDLQNTGSLTRQFWNQRFLFNSVNVSAIYFGSTQGEFFGLGFQGDQTWQIGRAGQSTQGKFYSYAIDSEGNPTKLREVGKPYDPRIRPWYQDAIKAGKPKWSEIYLDFKEPRQKLTLAQPIYNQAGVLQGVVGVDFVISHIQEFLKNLKVGKSGQIFIMDKSGSIVASSSNEEPFLRNKKGEITNRLQATDSHISIIRSTVSYLIEHLGELAKIDNSKQFMAEIENQQQFLQVTPLKDDWGTEWLIVIIIPEADFMEQINSHTQITILLCLVALILVIVLGVFTSRWICAPILRVSEASYALANGDLTQKVKGGSIKELRVLAQSFNQMATQLQESFTALAKTNEDLEMRVAQRTTLLASAEAELRGLFAAMTELILIIDAEGRYLKIVSTNSTLLYKPAEDLLGKTLHEVFLLEQANIFLGYIRKTLETGHPEQFEYSLILREEEVWFAASISPISPTSIIWVARDISSHKQAEKALRQSEERNRAILMGLPDLVIRCNKEGFYLDYISPRNFQSLITAKEVPIGKNFFEVLSPEIAQRQMGYIEQTLQTGEVQIFQQQLKIDNVVYDEEVRVVPINEDEVLIVIRDISTLKLLEKELSKSRQFLDSIVENIPLALFVKDVQDDFRYVLWNQTAEQVYAIPREQVIGRTLYDLVDSELAEQLHTQDQEAIKEGKLSVGEEIFDSKFQGTIWQRVMKLPLMNDLGEVTYLIYIAEDITERRQAEEALRLEQEKSEQLLLNILPEAIADQLKKEQRPIAEHFNEVTILFADIVGFTALSARMPAIELVNWLNEIFSTFDQLAEKHGLEKIKTIGDAYMVVGGLPVPKANHVEAVAEMALDMQASINRFQVQKSEPFQIRIGINTGQVVAGVIGIKKFIYDLWGDTVNVASRMESAGLPGNIQVTAATYERLQNKYLFEPRGVITVKGKGSMLTYWLTGRKMPE